MIHRKVKRTRTIDGIFYNLDLECGHRVAMILAGQDLMSVRCRQCEDRGPLLTFRVEDDDEEVEYAKKHDDGTVYRRRSL